MRVLIRIKGPVGCRKTKTLKALQVVLEQDGFICALKPDYCDMDRTSMEERLVGVKDEAPFWPEQVAGLIGEF